MGVMGIALLDGGRWGSLRLMGVMGIAALDGGDVGALLDGQGLFFEH